MSDRFIIEKQLSDRNSADAFLAVDNTTELKVRLRRIKSNMTPDQLLSVKDAFRVTQRQLALVKSDLVLQITDSGIDEDGAWLSLPFYENQQLLSYHTLPITLPDFHNLATQLLAALDAIHKENLVHGALTANSIDVVPPETQNGSLGYRIRDLGMRKLLLLVQNPTAISSLPSDHAILAPELFQKQDAEPTTDIYMAGQILYYLVAGGHPFVGLSEEEALQAHLSHSIPLAHTANPNIPEDVSLWLDKLTQPNPADRYQTVKDAIAELPYISPSISSQPSSFGFNHGALTAGQTVQAVSPSKKTPVYIYVIGALLLATAIGLFYAFKSDDTPATSDSSKPTKVKNSVDIKAISAGSITGELKIIEQQFVIGAEKNNSKFWGRGKTKGVQGADIGATHRAFVFFKIADIIDADNEDEIINVSSLGKVDLELAIDCRNKSEIQPVAFPLTIVKDDNAKQVRSIVKTLQNGVPGIPVKGSLTNRYTFKFNEVNLSEASYESYIIIPITADRTPEIGQVLNMEKLTATLKITK